MHSPLLFQVDSPVSNFLEISEIMMPNINGAMLKRSRYRVELIASLIR
ncbi:MAG: hypothetical protein QXO76_08535 [Thermoproteota archaeon]